MSARQRSAARLRAWDEGRAARDKGLQRTDNPYKQTFGTTGAWSLWGPWDAGWCERDHELSKEAP